MSTLKGPTLNLLLVVTGPHDLNGGAIHPPHYHKDTEPFIPLFYVLTCITH